MKILNISNQKNIQNFKSTNILPKRFTPLSLKETKKISEDIFIKSKEKFDLDKQIEKLYSKIEKEMQVLKPADIVLKTVKIVKNTNISPQEALKTLDIITQYASYKSLKNIEQWLDERKIESFSKLSKLYSSGVSDFKPNLNLALNYVLIRNLDNMKVESKLKEIPRAIVLDSILLDYLTNLPEEDFNKFKKYVKNNNGRFIYLKNFENGYNFLTCKGNIEDLAIKTINKSKNSKKINFDEKIQEALNIENYKKIKKLGLEVEVVEPPVSDNKINAKTIADKMNPIIPTKDEIKDFILKECEKQKQEDQIECQKHMLNFCEKMLLPISPKKFNEYLVSLSKKIEKFIQIQHKNPDNVYFLIPDELKSFMLLNYQFQKVNNLKNTKQIYPNIYPWESKYFDLQGLPENSTAVIIDDCLISGLSLAKEGFGYRETVKGNIPKNLSILFAPLFANKNGIDNIQNFINIYKRKSLDKIIWEQILPTWDNENTLFDKKYLGIESNNPYLSALTFPHVGPDTNSEKFVPIFEKFLYGKDAQKPTTSNLDFDYGVCF